MTDQQPPIGKITAGLLDAGDDPSDALDVGGDQYTVIADGYITVHDDEQPSNAASGRGCFTVVIADAEAGVERP